MIEKLKVLDLFSGIGGFSYGLELASKKFKTVAFCEQDAYATAVLNKHWPKVPVYPDIRKLKGEDVGKIDLICGGFPCQDISTAGKGAGLTGERSGLWFEYARIIGEVGPRWVIIENVSALRGRGLSVVLQNLSEIGYDAEWHCIPASSVGAPHRRDRIWIVAYPKSIRHREGGREPYIHQTDERQDRQVRTIFSGTSKQPENTPEAVAYPKSAGRQTRSGDVLGTKHGSRRDQRTAPRSGGEAYVAHTNSEGPQGQREVASGTSQEQQNTSDTCWWRVEPNVGRVANGVPKRVDRLRCLGNAVVPQVVTMIGHAILKADKAGY